jgi:hypothetical protein
MTTARKLCPTSTSLAAARASVSVMPADRPADLVAFYELRIRRPAAPPLRLPRVAISTPRRPSSQASGS